MNIHNLLLFDPHLPVPLKGWDQTISRNVSDYIHPHTTTSILSPNHLCSLPLKLLIVVTSAVGNLEQRMAIRDTWGNHRDMAALYSDSVKVVFMVGQDTDDSFNVTRYYIICNNDALLYSEICLQKIIAEESKKHNDIIQESFHDTYGNLTLKSCMLLKWVTSNCNSSKFVLKTDDDVFVNVPKLLRTLKRFRKPEVLMGYLFEDPVPVREPEHKWYVVLDNKSRIEQNWCAVLQVHARIHFLRTKISWFLIGHWLCHEFRCCKEAVRGCVEHSVGSLWRRFYNGHMCRKSQNPTTKSIWFWFSTAKNGSSCSWRSYHRARHNFGKHVLCVGDDAKISYCCKRLKNIIDFTM